ncbi:Rrf2 family transcriptional regulator [Sporosarcina luteola]|uniref:RrF2 family transcriptional regulator n=1 Tax=Sporosarcina luteola TaxID=582850 RepID=UPI00203D0D95|nr:Rrf2 family transcriptional regulator [Sporosarcina luteola]MCM3638355.1 Rrf2 family transcriptional regulator [Sporosarcina luteola]
MRLTLYTDYSLRVLMYLGTKETGELSTIQEISDRYNISKNHLTKVVHELGKMGLIATVRGRGGGIRLNVRPEEIIVGELVRKTEDDFYLVECFREDGNQCILSSACRLKGALHEALAAYLAVLDKYTIADFLVNKEELAAILLGDPL